MISKGFVAVTGGLVALFAAGLVGIWQYHEHGKRKARDELERTATALSDCLLGGPADGDVDQRLQRIRIASHATLTPDDTITGWPRRCSNYVNAIQPAHRAAYARGVIKTVPDLIATHDGLVDGNFTGAADALRSLADFTHGPHDPAIPLAPAPMTPLVASKDLAPIGPDFGTIRDLLVRSQDGLRLQMKDEDGEPMRGCEYSASTHALRCVTATIDTQFVPGDIGSDLVWWESLPATPDVVTLSDGKSLNMKLRSVAHGRTFKDGHLAVIETYEDPLSFASIATLILRDREGHVRRSPFDVDGAYASGARYGGAFVLWKERPSSPELPSLGNLEGNIGDTAPSPTERPANIKARATTEGSRTVTIGQVGRRPPTASRTDGTCEADHVFFDMSPALVVLDDKGGWHVLKQELLSAGSFTKRTMTCHGDTLEMVDQDEHEVRVQRCSVSAGCTSESVTVDLPKDSMSIIAGKDVVVVWPDTVAVATYLLRAPLADLPKAKPKAVADTAIESTIAGFGTYSAATPIVSFGDDAVFFLGSSKTYAFSAHKDGTVSMISAAP